MTSEVLRAYRRRFQRRRVYLERLLLRHRRAFDLGVEHVQRRPGGLALDPALEARRAEVAAQIEDIRRQMLEESV